MIADPDKVWIKTDIYCKLQIIINKIIEKITVAVILNHITYIYTYIY